jgi:hypothetical protein
MAPTLNVVRVAIIAELNDQRIRMNPLTFNDHEVNLLTVLPVAHAYVRRFGRTPANRWLAALSRLNEACHGYWPLNGAAILCENPIEVRTDAERRLHADRGAALRYADGFAVAAVHGTWIPTDIQQSPGRLRIDRIQAVTNVATRNALMALYGSERYRRAIARSARRLANEPNIALARELLLAYGDARFVRRLGAVVDEDVDHTGQPRRLWRARRRVDGPLAMVEVRNSTPDARGHRGRVWLRVPANIQTCQAAVAWTFGISAAEYKLAAES